MISPEAIKVYLLDKFKDNYKLGSGGEECIIPSIFIENDYKRHMSVNTSTGYWQCFKSGEKGNFIRLVSILEKIPYKRAEANLIFQSILLDGSVKSEPLAKAIKDNGKTSVILDGAIPIYTLTPYKENVSHQELQAWDYVYRRNLLNVSKSPEEAQFYIFPNQDSDYYNRLIIPFFNGEKVFHFQARSLDGRKPKYLAFKGIDQSKILYPFDTSEKYVVICEGPVDAISLQVRGINATATMTSHTSKTQMQMLYTFQGKKILSFNKDKAGMRGFRAFEKLRKLLGYPPFHFKLTPEPFKDWNDYVTRVPEIQADFSWVNFPEKFDELSFFYSNLNNYEIK